MIKFSVFHDFSEISKQVAHLVLTHANSSVPHYRSHRIIISIKFGLHVYLSSLCVFNGVGNKVYEDLGEPDSIGAHHRHIIFFLDLGRFCF